MYRKILVPMDGSPFSEEALREATRLAQQSGGQIQIISVLLEFAGAGPHIPKLDRQAEQQVAAYVTQQAQAVRAANVVVDHWVRWGQPAAVIVAAAQEFGADLIVMASHGVGAAGAGVPSVGFGGVTFKVLHDTTCPVLVLPIRPPR